MPNVRQRDWRLIPKITFHNWNINPNYGNMSAGLWNRWFSIERRWSGRIVLVCMRQFMLQLDFRKDWLADMVKPHDKLSASVRRANVPDQR